MIKEIKKNNNIITHAGHHELISGKKKENNVDLVISFC